MGETEKVESDMVETLSDNSSVNSDDYVPKGCQKMYHFNDGPCKQYLEPFDDAKILTFRANRKPATEYYEKIKSKKSVVG